MGRFLLPLDEVAYGYPTDEGPELLIFGTVVYMEETRVVLEPQKHFRKLGAHIKQFEGDLTIRMPAHGTALHFLLHQYFAALNRGVLHKHKVGLHFDGKEIFLA